MRNGQMAYGYSRPGWAKVIVGLLLPLVPLSGCGASSTRTVADPSTPATSANPVVTFAPGPTSVKWNDPDFATASCPEGHSQAACFKGSASATLTGVGRVSFSRVAYVGEGDWAVPDDCIAARTDGTLSDSHGGKLSFRGAGDMCRSVATYQLTSGTGTGSLANVTITGIIVNDAGQETWKVAVARRN